MKTTILFLLISIQVFSQTLKPGDAITINGTHFPVRSTNPELEAIIEIRSIKDSAIQWVLNGSRDSADLMWAIGTYTKTNYESTDKIIDRRNQLEFDYAEKYFIPYLNKRDTTNLINDLKVFQIIFRATTKCYNDFLTKTSWR